MLDLEKVIVSMKKQVLSLVMASMVAGVSPLFADGDHKHTEMGEEMETVSKSLKSLRKIAKDDYAAGAAAVQKAHVALLKSMSYTAAMVKEMPEGPEKAIALADSRRLLGLSYAALCELEVAYLKKDEALIKAAMDKVKASKKEGHKKYTDD